MLDYSKVSVKSFFCKTGIVPNGHHQAVTVETIRLLKEERERRKLSKYTVSKLSGVSQSMLSLVERGLRNPTLELLLRISDGIGADLPSIVKKAQSSVSKKGRQQ